mmetsp:Transcript_44404/g.51224  ORF Transcript_44404/g.51224 Transcript_44404/m.51224 type:complete len:80 (+) Transcript_44404:72-311(+)
MSRELINWMQTHSLPSKASTPISSITIATRQKHQSTIPPRPLLFLLRPPSEKQHKQYPLRTDRPSGAKGSVGVTKTQRG